MLAPTSGRRTRCPPHPSPVRGGHGDLAVQFGAERFCREAKRLNLSKRLLPWKKPHATIRRQAETLGADDFDSLLRPLHNVLDGLDRRGRAEIQDAKDDGLATGRLQQLGAVSGLLI